MAGQSGVVAEDHPRDPGMVSRARSALTASRLLEKQAVLLLALQGSMSAMAKFHHLRRSPIRVVAPITFELPTIRPESCWKLPRAFSMRGFA
jgi:hypothetical protein